MSPYSLNVRPRLTRTCIFIAAATLMAACADSPTPIPPEGYVDVPGGRVWYQTLGAESTGTPLVVIHGGPGFGSCSYISTLTGIAEDRPVILYDQLGVGRSDPADDLSLWEIPRFLEEIDALRAALRLDEVHVLGHSWGGTLAIEYMLTRPTGVSSVVFVGPMLSTPRWVEEAADLIGKLPSSEAEALRQGEVTGDYTSPEYLAATDSFYSRFLVRSEWPWPVLPGCENDPGPNMQVYEYMWGPTEFTATGTLLDFDRVDRLPELGLPVLFVVGRYDEIPVATVEEFAGLVPGAAIEIIEDAGHMVNMDGTEAFNSAVAAFLGDVDGR